MARWDLGRIARALQQVPAAERVVDERARDEVERRVAAALAPQLGSDVTVDLHGSSIVGGLADGVVPRVTITATRVPIEGSSAWLADLAVELVDVALPRGPVAEWGAHRWTAASGTWRGAIDAVELLVAARSLNVRRSRDGRFEWLDVLLPFVRRLSFAGQRLRIHLSGGPLDAALRATGLSGAAYLDAVVRTGVDEVVVDLVGNPGVPLPSVLRRAIPAPPWRLPADGLPLDARLDDVTITDDRLVGTGTMTDVTLHEP